MTASAADDALARARALIRPADLLAADPTTHGYIDLIGLADAPQPTVSQRAMNSRTVAAIYERLWRPIGLGALALYGITRVVSAKTQPTGYGWAGPSEYSTLPAALAISLATSAAN